MAGAHVIETLSFEIAFSREADAHAQHMRFGDFAAGRGVVVIGEVFDEFVGEGETVRLDQLEVDLGETLAAWSEAEAEQRLREALRRALRAAIGERRPGRPPPADPAADAAAELDMVWGHLHHGLLPWSADPASPQLFDALVARVLAARGAELAARLRASPALPRLIARIARQWTDEALAALARWLAPGEAETPADPAAEALVTAQAWEARLLALVGGAAPTSAEPGATLWAARAGLTVSEAAWPALINGQPVVVRARLREAGQTGEARARLAALLNETRQRQVLGLWAAPTDADFILALLAEPRAWRLGAVMSAEALRLALRRGLLDHLLAQGREQLDVAACVESLVAARALTDGLSPQIVAAALVAAWPTDGPSAAVRARLRAALAARPAGLMSDAVWPAFPSAAGPAAPVSDAGRPGAPSPGLADGSTPDEAEAATTSPDIAATSAAGRSPSVTDDRQDAPSPDDRVAPAVAQRGWRFDVGDGDGDDAATVRRDDPWRRQLRLEPAGLAAHLRRLGRSAAWRRRLARDLTPARRDEILSLWAQPAEAAFVVAVVEAVEPWRLGTAHAAEALAVRLREWLLDDLLLAPPGPPREGRDIVIGLVRRRGGHDDLSPAVVARALAAAWPIEGAPGAHRERLLAVLAEIEGAAGALPALEADPVTLEGAASDDLTDAEISPTQGETRRRLEASFARREFGEESATLLRAALADDLVWLGTALHGHASEPAFRDALAAGLPAGLLFELAQPGLSETQARLVLTLAPETARDVAAAQAFWSEVLAAVWAKPRPSVEDGAADLPLALSAPIVRATTASFLRRLLHAAAPAERRDRVRTLRAARLYVRDEVVSGPRPAAPDALPSLAAWRGQLPARPTAPAARALSALLTPAATGLRQLAEFSEQERRALVISLRPRDAAAALGALEVLTEAARAVSLSEPGGGWIAFNWRAVLRELFEEGRDFDLLGFTARWFEAWVAAAPAGDEVEARNRLALALEAARVKPAAVGVEAAGATGSDEAFERAAAARQARSPGRGDPDADAAGSHRADAASSVPPSLSPLANPGGPGPIDSATSPGPSPPTSDRHVADGAAAAGHPDAPSKTPPVEAQPGAKFDLASSSRSLSPDGQPRLALRTGEAVATGRPVHPDAAPPADGATPQNRTPDSGTEASSLGAPTHPEAESPGRLDGDALAAPAAGQGDATGDGTAIHASTAEATPEGPGEARGRGLTTSPVPFADAAATTGQAPRAPEPHDRGPAVARADLRPSKPAAAEAPPVPRPDPAALAAALRPEPGEATADQAAGARDAEPNPDGALYVANAGLVLAGPYIPMLLSRLELTRNGQFVDDRAQERAVHLLQFLVDGEDEPAAEHRLVLNKLVCGLDFPIPVGRDFEIRPPEQAMVESLLRTMIQRWEILGRTSIAGLRETFLVRQGALTREDEAWRLVVEPRPFDMLLDRIPWGYGTLKLPWMAQVLHVDWR